MESLRVEIPVVISLVSYFNASSTAIKLARQLIFLNNLSKYYNKSHKCESRALF